jgi:hypothetical protein
MSGVVGAVIFSCNCSCLRPPIPPIHVWGDASAGRTGIPQREPKPGWLPGEYGVSISIAM